ncbi:MAG: hypothetical protein E7043_05370 [Lentisphaerae bacterium]|nr:hypothetical protein [Lentisphaerota bacterium]
MVTGSMFDIQKEIDLCAASGGGEVVLPPGNYLTGTIFLRSNIHLVIPEGSIITGSADLADYPAAADKFSDGIAQERGRALIMADHIENASVTGGGEINGQGGKFPLEGPEFPLRPMLMRFVNCRNITLKDIKLRAPAAWTCHLRSCENVIIDHLDIFSHANSNNDGIDIDSCKKVEVRDCQIDSGDDAVCLKSTAAGACENISISGCELRSMAAAFKVGTETYGDIRQVKFCNCRIMRGNMGAIKLFSADGARLEDITISDVTVTQAANPFFIRLGSRGRCYDDSPQKGAGCIRNISVSGLRADIILHPEAIRSVNYLDGVPEYAHNCLAIMGLPDNPVENVSFRNISLNLPGSMTGEPQDAGIPEFADGYPEIGYYGVLPAYGIFMRHVRKVDFSGCDISLTAPDCRQKIVLDDAREITGI